MKARPLFPPLCLAFEVCRVSRYFFCGLHAVSVQPSLAWGEVDELLFGETGLMFQNILFATILFNLKGKLLEDLGSTEKVFQHRILPVGVGFGCQDCRQTAEQLMDLVSKPCEPVVDVDPKLGTLSQEERTELEREAKVLREQEELLEQMILLESLREQEEKLLLDEAQSMINATIPASSDAAPFPRGTPAARCTCDQIHAWSSD